MESFFLRVPEKCFSAHPKNGFLGTPMKNRWFEIFKPVQLETKAEFGHELST